MVQSGQVNVLLQRGGHPIYLLPGYNQFSDREDSAKSTYLLCLEVLSKVVVKIVRHRTGL